jgi:hypothetical protein
MALLRAGLSILAVLIVLLTGLAAVASFFLGSMQNVPQKSIDPWFIAYGLAGVAVIYALSRRDIQTPSVILACVWAGPAVFVIIRMLVKVL